MKIAATIGIAVLTGAGLLCGQAAHPANKAPAPAQANSLAIGALPAANSCPVGMHVKQGSSMQMIRSADGTTQPLMTPSLTLTGHDSRQIVESSVTAYGFPSEGVSMNLVAHLVQPGQNDKPPAIERKLDLKMVNDGNGGATAQLMLPGFAGVSSIALDSVTYSDGSTWKPGAKAGCRVPPDPLLLIAGR